MELLCPAGSVAALKAAIEHGADAVYVGLKNDTNARNFAGLNLDDLKLAEACAYVHKAGKKLHVAINTFAHPQSWQRWQQAVDQAVIAGADALIIADMSVLAYAAERYPQVERHLSVQASATNLAAIEFYRQYGISRVVLPRVLSIAQVRALARSSDIDLEVFAFVRWQEKSDGQLESRLNGVLIDSFAPGETTGYPTLCKGRFEVDGERYHTLEEPTSLNTLALLPELHREGIKSLKIEGRQRSPAYVASLTRVWRQAIDALLDDPSAFNVQPAWDQLLASLSEGSQTTLGAYHRAWK